MKILLYILLVPNATITTLLLPSDPIQGAMVGSPQDIQCIVSTVSGVELSSVMIGWMGPGGESITNDSRVTISPTTSSGNNYTSSLQFTYLMEGDEGMYTCNVMILDISISDVISMNNLGSKWLLLENHDRFIMCSSTTNCMSLSNYNNHIICIWIKVHNYFRLHVIVYKH